ncbi:MAG: biotin synthase BioB [Planctomycetes bacterium]|nr:biotin synthase BioB [Planctomycetota bacterium]
MSMDGLNELGERILAGGEPATEEEAVQILEADPSEVFELAAWANRIRKQFKGDKVHLCAIINAKSGGCPEDCTFCAQSAHYDTGVQRHNFLGREEVLRAARDARMSGAQALGIVTAWRGLKDGPVLDEVCQRIRELAESGIVRADASLGIIESPEVAQRLKDSGLHCYNHNLETARSHFPNICSTHTFDDRIRTIHHLKTAGLKVCSGGIFGMGETVRQRVELALELRRLDVDIVPLNFLHRIVGTPQEKNEPLPPLEILKTIAMFRFVLPRKEIMIAGGREVNLRDLQSLIFHAGASALMVGNYLTTQGRGARADLQMLKDLGLDPKWPGWDHDGEAAREAGVALAATPT